MEVHHLDGKHNHNKWELGLLHQHNDQVHQGMHDKHQVVESRMNLRFTSGFADKSEVTLRLNSIPSEIKPHMPRNRLVLRTSARGARVEALCVCFRFDAPNAFSAWLAVRRLT